MGEPLLYPRFEDVLKFIYTLNSKNSLIHLTTNGTKLSKNIAELLNGHLGSVIISLNAANAETYNKDMRNGDFEKTLSAIQAFQLGLNKNERAKIVLHFVAHSRNFREIPEFVALANNLGIGFVTIEHYMVQNVKHTSYSIYHIKNEYNEVVNEARRIGRRLGIFVNIRRQFFGEKKYQLINVFGHLVSAL